MEEILNNLIKDITYIKVFHSKFKLLNDGEKMKYFCFLLDNMTLEDFERLCIISEELNLFKLKLKSFTPLYTEDIFYSINENELYCAEIKKVENDISFTFN